MPDIAERGPIARAVQRAAVRVLALVLVAIAGATPSAVPAGAGRGARRPRPGERRLEAVPGDAVDGPRDRDVHHERAA
jgi:hypothetical protein